MNIYKIITTPRGELHTIVASTDEKALKRLIKILNRNDNNLKDKRGLRLLKYADESSKEYKKILDISL